MSEPIEPPVLDSRNSNCRSDSNSERDGTPERTPEQTPASPPVLEETVVESVVKIVGTTNSNLSDKSIPHDRTLLPSRKEPLCHSTSDGDILKESRTRVQTPENIEYVRSKSGFSDAIGNKVITASTKVHGVSSEYVRLHRALIGITIPKEIDAIIEEGAWRDPPRENSGSGSGQIFGEGEYSEGSGNSDPSEPYENFEPRGFDLSQLNNTYFSIRSIEEEEEEEEEEEREHHSD